MADLPSAYPLRDLFDAAARGRNIRLTCRACGHSAIFAVGALWWLFQRRSWIDDFDHVRRRCVCSRCWRGTGRRVRNPGLDLVEAAPTETDLPLPPDREWKRELRRRR